MTAACLNRNLNYRRTMAAVKAFFPKNLCKNSREWKGSKSLQLEWPIWLQPGTCWIKGSGGKTDPALQAGTDVWGGIQNLGKTANIKFRFG
ncbi:hypothetical protein CUU66_15985 [Peribacillus deserti]|uniref:Uncharacterized protein n=1 Tax=Peribacillus deserti TaxID=673318 RepID=A0A2N5M3Q2_9BACI|nr:hypothetical protein CUU66_15985 [Peribacillus deserti]